MPLITKIKSLVLVLSAVGVAAELISLPFNFWFALWVIVLMWVSLKLKIFVVHWRS